MKRKRCSGCPAARAAHVLLLLSKPPSLSFMDRVGNATELAPTAKKAANIHRHRHDGRPCFLALAQAIFSIPKEKAAAGMQASIAHPRAGAAGAHPCRSLRTPEITSKLQKGRGRKKSLLSLHHWENGPQKVMVLVHFPLFQLSCWMGFASRQVSLPAATNRPMLRSDMHRGSRKQHFKQDDKKIWPCSAFKRILSTRNLSGFNGEHPSTTAPAQTPAPALPHPGMLTRVEEPASD